MECKKEKNLQFCSCTYTACSKRGICCECIKYHRDMGEIPGCLFPKEAERVYDRSIEFFIKSWAEKLGYKLVKK
ncbi:MULTISPECIES: DUF6485 family protein [unclassified Desulfurobacterium]|uniref:DUF6485 family protein n=1 Tax=Desulfurobacterium sp. TC5-1 TaxID=1158318 RepID=UPI0003B3EBE4|nr:DUF6485 family protein [Desulfurobacterium sp. TC5-1]